MTLTASFFISWITAIFLIYLVHLIRQDKLLIKDSLYWFMLSLVVLVLVWFPELLIFLATYLGIYSPVNMIFFIGFCVSLWLIFWLTNTVSMQRHRIKLLTQKLALLEKEVDK